MRRRHRSSWSATAPSLVSYLMIVLDISTIITALPKIHSGLGFSLTGLSWVQNAYTLAVGGLLLLGARAGDILGRRRMFTLGIAIFTFASLLVSAAQSPAWLVSARWLQGAGAAILAASTLAVLQSTYPQGSQRTRAVAYYGAVAGVGASLGLVLGGVFTSGISWRAGQNDDSGSPVTWGRHVTDEEYAAAQAADG